MGCGVGMGVGVRLGVGVGSAGGLLTHEVTPACISCIEPHMSAPSWQCGICQPAQVSQLVGARFQLPLGMLPDRWLHGIPSCTSSCRLCHSPFPNSPPAPSPVHLCSAARRQVLSSSRSGAVRSASDIPTNTTTANCTLAAKDARIAELEAQLAAVQAYLNDTLAELQDAYSQIADVNGELYASLESVSKGGRGGGPEAACLGAVPPASPGTAEHLLLLRSPDRCSPAEPLKAWPTAVSASQNQMTAELRCFVHTVCMRCLLLQPSQGVDSQDALHDCLVDNISKQTQLIKCTQQAGREGRGGGAMGTVGLAWLWMGTARRYSMRTFHPAPRPSSSNPGPPQSILLRCLSPYP